MVRRVNPTTRALLDRLLRNYAPSPTAEATLRTALVRHNLETTYVVPADWPRRDGAEVWFEDKKPPDAGSDVQYLIDGRQTYDAMLEAMETAEQKGHFILLLGWWLQHEFKFAGGKSFLDVARERGKLGVAVRVLLYDSPLIPDKEKLPEMAAFAKLRTDEGLDVHAQLDDRTREFLAPKLAVDAVEFVAGPVVRWLVEGTIVNPNSQAAKTGNAYAYGSHHHKIVLVFGRDGLVGFCGGLDINGDRETWYHDAHLRVLGGAARELLTLVEQRWSHARDNWRSPAVMIDALVAPAHGPNANTVNPYLARVFQTVGNPDLRPKVPDTLWPAIRHAVKTAQRFIYIEDQYLISLDLIEELVEAAKRLKHIIIVVPEALHEGEVRPLRLRAIAYLQKIGGPEIGKKIKIFQLGAPSIHGRLHSKLFVFDDEYALVGSANANNRGYFLDSEADIGVAEYHWDRVEGLRNGLWANIEANFARRMRIELWAEHLGLEPEELVDGVAAAVHWRQLPAGARVAPYRVLNVKRFLETGGEEETQPWWETIPDDWDPGFNKTDLVVDPKG
ncbi:MAG: phospholipase D-like domain-containing protein [Minicystis sp.]